MRKLLVSVIFLASLGILAQPIAAEPPCEPQGPCLQVWGIAPLVALSPNVPFAWLRSAPDSSAPVIYTIISHGVLNLHPEKLHAPANSDAWVEVSLFPNFTIHGWIEEKSLLTRPVIASPDYSAFTNVPTLGASWVEPPKAIIARLAAGVKYVWLRRLPSTMDIEATIFPGNSLVVLNTVDPYFDGVQWWWPVQYAWSQGVANGWIEQNSIVVTSTLNWSLSVIECYPSGACDTPE